MKKENMIFIGVLVVVFLGLVGTLIGIYIRVQNEPVRITTSEDGTFSTSFIRSSNEQIGENNYMISPYSVEMALSMLRDGANDKTKEEMEKVVPERSIKTLSIANRINIANAVFLKDIYKNDLIEDYKTKLYDKYQADIVVDKYETPDKINNWVKKQTNNMIPKILDKIQDGFVMGLANAIAMEETWLSPFECDLTTKQDFKLADGTKEKRWMMNQTFDGGTSYYSDDKVEGIIMPYQIYDPKSGKEEFEGEQLEFIALLPKDIKEYIKELDLDTIKKIDEEKRISSDELKINVTIPKFEYEYDFSSFKDTLISMGIETVFTPAADLSNMLNNHPDAYVNEAIHKTYVKVDEKGTKAAAVTYFGVKDNAMPYGEVEHINIKFDKPFIYLIKDTTSNEILFFGVVYDPKWDNKNSCE